MGGDSWKASSLAQRVSDEAESGLAVSKRGSDDAWSGSVPAGSTGRFGSLIRLPRIPDRALHWLEKRLGAHLTYSQCGEDLIIDRALRDLGITRPTYVDVGAFHPRELNNTALFYRRGLSGVCVEPDPDLIAVIARERARDICVNAGISSGESAAADFFVMSVRSLSTFSRERAHQLESSGECRIEKTLRIPLLTLNRLFEQALGGAPNLVSIDAEGLDLEVLLSMDYDRFRPQVLCVETLRYSDTRRGESKTLEIAAFLNEKGYFSYADTRVNTIFVDAKAWERSEHYHSTRA